MSIEKLWKVLPFPGFDPSLNRDQIHSENWLDFADFLTNGSNGVSVARVSGDVVRSIKEGDLIVYDTELTPESGDYVLNINRQVTEYVEGDVFAVITCIVKPQAAHRRQRME